MKMQKFTIGIEMELHVSPKKAVLEALREFGYDNSQSAPKVDEQRKKDFRSVYAQIKADLVGVFCPAVVKDGLSGTYPCF